MASGSTVAAASPLDGKTSISIESFAISPFTGAVATEIWGRRDGRPIFRCPDTGASFFDRSQLVHEDYQEYYPYLEEFDASRFDWEMRIRRGKFRRQLRQMERLAPGKRLLDIGAGPGYFCRVATENGWSATGIEVSTEAMKHGTEKLAVRYANLDEIPDGGVDAITCHHVLEHLESPAAFLETLHRKLATSGLLVVHVPHEQPLTFLVRDRLRRLVDPSGDTNCTLYGNIHISGFSRDSLERVVSRAGFETRFVRSVGMWSMYYDPFFLMNYVRSREWLAMVRKAVRGVIEVAGNFTGRGDWIIGYFSKAP